MYLPDEANLINKAFVLYDKQKTSYEEIYERPEG